MPKEIVLSYHALLKLEERGVPLSWVETTALSPDSVEPDPRGGGVMRAFRVIPEAGSRVLRVVYVDDDNVRRIVTAFLDRGRRT